MREAHAVVVSDSERESESEKERERNCCPRNPPCHPSSSSHRKNVRDRDPRGENLFRLFEPAHTQPATANSLRTKTLKQSEQPRNRTLITAIRVDPFLFLSSSSPPLSPPCSSNAMRHAMPCHRENGLSANFNSRRAKKCVQRVNRGLLLLRLPGSSAGMLPGVKGAGGVPTSIELVAFDGPGVVGALASAGPSPPPVASAVGEGSIAGWTPDRMRQMEGTGEGEEGGGTAAAAAAAAAGEQGSRRAGGSFNGRNR